MLHLHGLVLYTYKRGMGKSYYASPCKVNAIHYFHDPDPGHDSGWSIALIRWCRIIRNSVVCLIGQMKNATAYCVTACHPGHMSSSALYHPPILFSHPSICCHPLDYTVYSESETMDAGNDDDKQILFFIKQYYKSGFILFYLALYFLRN